MTWKKFSILELNLEFLIQEKLGEDEILTQNIFVKRENEKGIGLRIFCPREQKGVGLTIIFPSKGEKKSKLKQVRRGVRRPVC